LVGSDANTGMPASGYDGSLLIISGIAGITIDELRVSNIQRTYTSVDNNKGALPTIFVLSQNYPNPFNPSTTINYSVPKLGLITINVYNVLGQELATLVNEEKPVGNYKVEFNANKLATGIYYYRIQAGSFVETKKMVLLK